MGIEVAVRSRCLGLFSRFNPIDRAGRAIRGGASQLQEPESAQAAAEFYLGAANKFAAAQAEPPVVRASPNAEPIEPLK